MHNKCDCRSEIYDNLLPVAINYSGSDRETVTEIGRCVGYQKTVLGTFCYPGADFLKYLSERITASADYDR